MKLAHVVNWTPGGCGMYETVRDLVVYERRAGADARIVDVRDYAPPIPGPTVRPTGKPCPRCGYVTLETMARAERPPVWAEDRGVVLAPASWLDDVDLIVSHSGMPDIPPGRDKPRVHVAHGRPHSSFLLGKLEGNHVYKSYAEYAADPRWKMMITLWPGFADYWRLVFSKPIHEVRPFVDLDRWRPAASNYDFHGKAGRPNVVVADVWRHDRDPFHVLHALAAFGRTVPEARVHLYGIDKQTGDALMPILAGLGRLGVLGEVMGRVDNLVEVYNAADLLATPHSIAVRTIREALACGLPVVAGRRCEYTSFHADDEDVAAYAAEVGRAWSVVKEYREAQRNTARGIAEREFDPTAAVNELLGLFEGLLKG